jgi:hypothetical protein
VRRTGLALLTILLGAGSAAAQWDGRLPDPLPSPLPLPETLRGTVVVPVSEAPAAGALSRLREIYPAIAACWRVPDGLARLERGEVTVRFSLRRDGSVQGTPRVTFANLAVDGAARQRLTEAAIDAVRRCTPLHLTDGLGGAVAGRPFAVRFVYQGPKGQGV